MKLRRQSDAYIIITSLVGDVAGELAGKALALALEDGDPAGRPKGGAAGHMVLEHRLQRLLIPDHLHVLHPHNLHPSINPRVDHQFMPRKPLQHAMPRKPCS